MIAAQDLGRDLRDWDQLYVAGRMQKPVLTLRRDATLAEANRGNVDAALAAALLLLPGRFTVQVSTF